MKKIIILFTVLLVCTSAFSQTWTAAQLAKANTGKDVAYLSKIEKETIMYINLARLYPKEFVKYELANYWGTEKYGENLRKSKYKASLISTLSTMSAVNALVPEKELYEDAKCLANEQGANGEVGHERKKCKEGKYAECCSYGMPTGKDVTMQWLVDHEVTSLGHRKNCLNKSYTKIGVCEHTHPKWDTCSIAEFYY